MKRADGKCSYVSKKKFPWGEGKSIISHNSQEMGGGEAVVESSQAQNSSVDRASTELDWINSWGWLDNRWDRTKRVCWRAQLRPQASAPARLSCLGQTDHTEQKSSSGLFQALWHRLLSRPSSYGYSAWSISQLVCLHGCRTWSLWLSWTGCSWAVTSVLHFFPPISLTNLLYPLLKSPL